jgi:hypothetical protein
MTPVELLNGLRRLGACLTLSSDKVHVSAPAGVVSAELRQQMSENKPALLDLLRAESAAAELSPIITLDQIGSGWLPEPERVIPAWSVITEVRRVLPELNRHAWPKEAQQRLLARIQPGDRIGKVTDDFLLVAARPPRRMLQDLAPRCVRGSRRYAGRTDTR